MSASIGLGTIVPVNRSARFVSAFKALLPRAAGWRDRLRAESDPKRVSLHCSKLTQALHSITSPTRPSSGSGIRLANHPNSTFGNSASEARCKSIIPPRAYIVSGYGELAQLFICNLSALSIHFHIELGLHRQATGSCRASNKCHHHIEAAQRLASPIYADVAEQPVFHRVPF
jgi:hypothetical protein